MADLEKYLEEVNFSQQLKKLEKKLKNKKIIIYGTGSLFILIERRWDLSKLNIIGVSDKKYNFTDARNDFHGYKIIVRPELAESDADYILVASYEYLPVIRSLERNYLNKSKIKILPLVKYPLSKTLLEILF